MSDSAKGSISGYLYQFERAFLLLCDITEEDGYISIEKIDDVAVHSSDGSIVIIEQDKSSILESGTSFEDTSKDLWRTIELWIIKIKNNSLNDSTKFYCSTNKIIPETSLIKFIHSNRKSFDLIIEKIKELKNGQEKKLDNYKKKDSKKGTFVKKILELINFALENQEQLKIIVTNISIYENTNLKKDIVSRLRLSSYTDLQQDKIYNNIYGWILSICKYKWNNNQFAEIKKEEFDYQYKLNLTSPAILNAIFRAKKDINIDTFTFESKKDEIFVKQINLLGLRQSSKELFVRKAIEDFIRYEIEHTYIIDKGNLTKEDFIEFLSVCKEKWELFFYSLIIKDIENYTEDEMNELGIKVYSYILNDLEIKFRNDISFSTENIYIKNGSFLKLSNIPEIGWHPNWEKLINE